MNAISQSKVNTWMTVLASWTSVIAVRGPASELKVCGNLNSATFLREKENETPDHDCLQFLTLNYTALEDRMDTPLDNPGMEIFTDGIFLLLFAMGSRLLRDGIWIGFRRKISLPGNQWSVSGACGSDLSSRVNQRPLSKYPHWF